MSETLHAGDLADLLSKYLPQLTFAPAGAEIVCGVSGGADSLALLALGVASGCSVTAVHVDHGQRDGSVVEAELVRTAATSIGARFQAHTVDVSAGSNLEARLRAARYKVLGPDACTGHTADDQAETMLINLIRGAGLVGLGAMQPGRRRPLLALRRADTEQICRLLDWEPLHDPTNIDSTFVRNRVRHELLPLMCDIAQRDVVPLLVRTAAHARDAAGVIDGLAAALDACDVGALRAAPRAVASTALQHWIRSATDSEHPVDSAAIDRVLAVVDGDSIAAEVTGGWRVSRSGQRLRIG